MPPKPHAATVPTAYSAVVMPASSAGCSRATVRARRAVRDMGPPGRPVPGRCPVPRGCGRGRRGRTAAGDLWSRPAACGRELRPTEAGGRQLGDAHGPGAVVERRDLRATGGGRHLEDVEATIEIERVHV